MDKLISAIDLLRQTFEQSTAFNDNKGGQGGSNRFHGQRGHHHHRRNNPGYSEESQTKKSVDINGDDRMLKRKDKVGGVIKLFSMFLKKMRK